MDALVVGEWERARRRDRGGGRGVGWVLDLRAALLPVFCVLLADCIVPAQASATPAVAVYPANASLATGDSFVAEITIANVDAQAPLAAFEFDLDFDPSLLRPKAVSPAGFLPRSAATLESKLLSSSVEFAAAGISGPGHGSGVLARVRFDVLGPGAGTLDLNNVKLSSVGGISLHPGSLLLPDDRVTDGQYVATPEPSAPLLSGAALLVLWLLARRKRKREDGAPRVGRSEVGGAAGGLECAS